jgi:hypothetical protein
MDHRILKGALLVALAAYPPDDWPAARAKGVFSGDGTHFVRIVPGDNLGATVGFQGAPNGRNARAEFYARQRDRSYRLISDVLLPNPIAPVEALLSNAGLLITFDNWHNVGYGKVVVIYNERGSVVRSYALEQVYSSEDVSRVPTSESSRWWRCAPPHFVEPDEQRHVYVPEFSGGYFVFDLQTGAVTHTAGSTPCSQSVGAFSLTSR